MNANSQNKLHWFEAFATKATKMTGSDSAFIIACLFILVWLISGPLFGFSDTWQMVINTTTTIITFLMVFLIQKTQNKDVIAMHIKLNELVAAHDKASNRIVSIEDLSEDELVRINEYYTLLAEKTKKENSQIKSTSIEDTSITEDEKKKNK